MVHYVYMPTLSEFQICKRLLQVRPDRYVTTEHDLRYLIQTSGKCRVNTVFSKTQLLKENEETEPNCVGLVEQVT